MAAIKLELVAIRTYHGGRYTVHARNDDYYTRDDGYPTGNVNQSLAITEKCSSSHA